MEENQLKSILKTNIEEINRNLGSNRLTFHQQKVTTKNMSVSGFNGRIWFNPVSDGFDISLSGKSLENQLSNKISALAGRDCDGFKQVNSNKGIKKQPYWRFSDPKYIRIVLNEYIKTSK